MGSAGAKAMAVVRGEADVSLHTGGQYEWDNCAPVAVAEAAGLHVSRVDGSPIRYNNPAPYLPALQIGRAHVCTPVTNAHFVCRLLLDTTSPSTPTCASIRVIRPHMLTDHL